MRGLSAFLHKEHFLKSFLLRRINHPFIHPNDDSFQDMTFPLAVSAKALFNRCIKAHSDMPCGKL